MNKKLFRDIITKAIGFEPNEQELLEFEMLRESNVQTVELRHKGTHMATYNLLCNEFDWISDTYIVPLTPNLPWEGADIEVREGVVDEKHNFELKFKEYGKLMGYSTANDAIDEPIVPVVVYMKEDGTLTYTWVDWVKML